MPDWMDGRSLLDEIDSSVLTWCSDHRPADAVFHGAVIDEWNPTDEELELGWRNFREMEGREPRALHEVVFRKPTWEHVPKKYGLRAAPAKGTPATGLPFQPFMHFRYKGGRPVCVLKSHWVGSVSGGRFRGADQPQGRLTERLGAMMNLLVDKYAMQNNWRGYSSIEEMKGDARLALVVSILKCSPLKGGNPFGYVTRIMKTAFIARLHDQKDIWDNEHLFEAAENDERAELWDFVGGESWRETASREFDEAEAAFNANK